jgi:hypothetical protein
MYQLHEAQEGVVPRPRAHGLSSRFLPFAAAAALAPALLATTSATAFAFGTTVACSPRVEAKPFAAWGDTAQYFRVPNGGFEYGSVAWALSGGAAVVPGNEPYQVAGAADSHSLRLPPGSAAESRTICVSSGEDTIRLFVNNAHVPGSILHVDVVARNPTTGALGYAAFDVNGDVPSSAWAPTMRLTIPKMFDASGTQEITLRFTLRGAPATWLIDDVYVDPFKSW